MCVVLLVGPGSEPKPRLPVEVGEIASVSGQLTKNLRWLFLHNLPLNFPRIPTT